jgi:hypothetical protein
MKLETDIQLGTKDREGDIQSLDSGHNKLHLVARQKIDG